MTLPLSQALAMVLRGEITDAKTQVGVLLLAQRYGTTPTKEGEEL